MINLVSILEFNVKTNPEKTAIVFGGMRFSFKQINAMANQVANGLIAAGIGKGDKVAISCPNLPFFPVIYYGVLKLGAVLVPMNVLLKGREIAFHLNDSETKAFFCFEGTPELPMAQEGHAGFMDAKACEHMWVITADPQAASPLEGIPTMAQMMGTQSPEFDTVLLQSDDSAVILYTSGTTGTPKGAELTHMNLVMNSRICVDLLQLTEDDVQLIVAPLFHSMAQTIQMNAGFTKGNTLVLLPRFTPESVLDAMQKENVTVFVGVPTMYWAILNYEDKENRFDFVKIADTLRLGLSGGASMPGEIIKGIESKYKVPVLEGYGISETSPGVAFNPLNKTRKQGSVGPAIWGVDLKIVDPEGQELPVGEVGEIVVRGHNVMKGYYNNPEETAKAVDENGWFHSGDLGRVDEDGYVFIVDRLKDLIIRGGFNVYPREIEEVLMTHPAISMAAVLGIPHESHGEEVKAFVVLKEGAQATEEEIINWSREQMAAYKYPRVVQVQQTLPMTATGKILKKELRT